ncbi:MAG: hypothetical protein NC044_05460 [Prevotella sp.]|nr:hypothetical protein [Lachnospiraceae bacterium]MCM1379563.1 hypothetical protein [Bacteroides sp.]MCM1445835.1 hypothetical protein [Prevotella sp.]
MDKETIIKNEVEIGKSLLRDLYFYKQLKSVGNRKADRFFKAQLHSAANCLMLLNDGYFIDDETGQVCKGDVKVATEFLNDFIECLPNWRDCVLTANSSASFLLRFISEAAWKKLF